MLEDKEVTTRKTVKMKKPNPLFEKWLTEWEEDAKNRHLETKVMFSKALKSLKKYPLPLKSGKECLILENFGTYISEKLDQKLAEHRESQTTYSSLCCTIDDNKELKTKKSKETKKTNIKENSSGRKRATKEYIPTWRSAAYALLVTLFNKLSEAGPPGEMTKAELLTCAQVYCDTSLTKPDIGSHSYYTGWTAMTTLVKRNFVRRQGHPPKFSLTESGIVLAEKLPTFELNCVETSLLKSVSVDDSQLQNQLKATFSKNMSINDVKEDYAQEKTQVAINQEKFVTSVESEEREAAQENSECLIKLVSGKTCSNTIVSSSGEHSDSHKSHSETNIFTDIKYDKVNDDNFPTQSSVSSQPSIHSSDNSQPSTQPSLYSQPEPFLPGSFKIILVVDTQEVFDERAIQFLEKNGILVEVRKLCVGDYIWICQNCQGEELVLPYIIERKRLDDFAKSISDGRFHEQKFRLKRCGLEQCIYLIEKHSRHGLPLNTLHQAAVNTQVHDKFFVKFTDDLKDSLNYLGTLTGCLIKLYSTKILISSDRSSLPKDDSCAYLMTYRNFNENSVKIRNFTISEMFVRHLVQLHGLSVEKASAIIEKYPTPHSLMEAYKYGGDENLLTLITVGKSGRKIGPVISKTLHKMYTSTNLK